MKKTLLILLISIISLTTYCQVKIKGNIKLGYETISLISSERFSDNVKNEIVLKTPNVSWMGELGVKALYKGFEVKTSVHTIFYKDKYANLDFYPLLAEYVLSFKYSINKISAVYEHSCTHQIVNSLHFMPVNGGYDRIYLEIEF